MATKRVNINLPDDPTRDYALELFRRQVQVWFDIRNEILGLLSREIVMGEPSRSWPLPGKSTEKKLARHVKALRAIGEVMAANARYLAESSDNYYDDATRLLWDMLTEQAEEHGYIQVIPTKL